MKPDYERWFKANHRDIRRQMRTSFMGTFAQPSTKAAFEVTDQERWREYEAHWRRGGVTFAGSFADLMISEEANRTAADFVREKIRGIVDEPGVAEVLVPKDYPIGSKRICLDTGYYATYNRANVTLVDVRPSPIQEVTPKGVRTVGGEYEVNAIVYATGFDAMTGPLLGIDIRGRRGLRLRDKWAAGPRTYLGLVSAGFPNMFTITGPGSPSVLSNMVVSIEQHVDWIADCIDHVRTRHLTTIDADPSAEDAWVDHVNEAASGTLYTKANSWYLGANVPGKPRIFMPYAGGVGTYREKCDSVAANGYEGFVLTS